jgi:thioredoxin reductase
MPASHDATYDAIIIGGGPAGLSAALLLGRSCRRVAVIDAAQPRNAAARAVHGFLGSDGMPPQDLLAAARQQLARYEVEFLRDVVTSGCRLTSADLPCPTAFSVTTQNNRTLRGRKLLLATGMHDTLPKFPGVRECYGVTIHHCPYCDGWEHRGQRILVYGMQAKEAVGLGLALRGWSKDVTVLTDGHPVDRQQTDRLAKNGISLASEKIVRFLHRGDLLEGVELAGSRVLPAEAMFFHSDQRPGCDLPRSLGVECEDEFARRTSRKQTTNVPGLFVAGDADGDVQFVIVAAAEGAKAAVAMNRELQDEDRA